MKVNLNLSIALIALFLFACAPKNASRHNSESEKATIYFRPGVFELISSDQADALSSLSPTGKYHIRGYSCTEDMLSSTEELLAIADRRANAVRNILIKKGFAPQNISIMAYAKGPECKAVIVEMH